MRSTCLVAILALGVLAAAQEAKPSPAAAIPTPAELDRAIEQFARGIPQGITADRYAAMAVAMPQDAAEYQALNKHALLVVAALSKDASELPLKRVYLEQEKRTIEFSPFAVVSREVPADSAAGKLMGTHRVDAYYLIPLSAWRQPGTLLADFAAHRQEFILGKSPQPIKEEFIGGDKHPEAARGRNIAAEAIRGIVERAVPGWASSGQRVPAFMCMEKLPAEPYALCEQVPQRIRVSQGVAQALQVHSVTPRYPEEAKANHVQGTVVMRVVIGKDGAVQEVHVLSGDPLLAAAAVDAVQQWRYRPYLIQGNPVEVEAQVTILFRLD